VRAGNALPVDGRLFNGKHRRMPAPGEGDAQPGQGVIDFLLASWAMNFFALRFVIIIEEVRR